MTVREAGASNGQKAMIDHGGRGANGLSVDRQGRLVLCQHGNRQLARLEKDGSYATVVARYDGKRLNSPNDLAVRKNGDIYFTDPPYGLEKIVDSPLRELPFAG